MIRLRLNLLLSLGDDAQAVRELRDLLEVYVQLRPRVIDSMGKLMARIAFILPTDHGNPCTCAIRRTVRVSRANAAYDLAERYRDFRSLVVLCNDPSTGSTARVHHYIQKYKEDFAYALYDWYLETGTFIEESLSNTILIGCRLIGRTHELMTQDSTYGPMVSAYLRLRKLPGLAWMQDVTEGKVMDASKALLLQADQERKLSGQKVCILFYFRKKVRL